LTEVKPTLEYDGGTVYMYYKKAGGSEPAFFSELAERALVLELYACCIDCHSSNGVRGHCWYSFFWMNGRLKILRRPGGQALSMKLQPFAEDVRWVFTPENSESILDIRKRLVGMVGPKL